MAKPEDLESEESIPTESDEGEEKTDDSDSDAETATQVYEVVKILPPSSPLKKSQPAQLDSSEESDSESEANQKPITKPLPKPQPPSDSDFSSSSEHEESKSESESEADAKPTPQPSWKPQPSVNSSSYESESELEADQNITSRAKSTVSEPVNPAKRPAQENGSEAKDGKRVKKNSGAPFRRLWSEEDEIVILTGMLDFEAEKKSNPATNVNAFLDFIKKKLHVDVNRTQLQTKMRRLKEKYDNNRMKGRTTFTPHDQEIFQVSERIWGHKKEKADVPENDGVAGAPNREGVKSAAVEMMLRANRPGSLYGSSSEDRLMRIGSMLFQGEQEVDGTKEWNKLCIEEMEIKLKQLDVARAKMVLVLSKLKSID